MPSVCRLKSRRRFLSQLSNLSRQRLDLLMVLRQESGDFGYGNQTLGTELRIKSSRGD